MGTLNLEQSHRLVVVMDMNREKVTTIKWKHRTEDKGQLYS
jgi:hypothetical protein